MKQITNRNRIKQLQLNFSIVSSYGIKLLIERQNVNKDISQTVDLPFCFQQLLNTRLIHSSSVG